MEFEIKTASTTDMLYAAKQHQQLIGQCGCYGRLSVVVSEIETSTSWTRLFGGKKDIDAKTRVETVIAQVRKQLIGKFESSKAEECYFRIDDDNLSYLIKVYSNEVFSGEIDTNIEVYAYEKDWLNEHVSNASRGIRFINSNYKNLFRIKDGESIIVTFTDGSTEQYSCRYTDDYHLIVQGTLYHICEFAERMEKNGNKCSPVTTGEKNV